MRFFNNTGPMRCDEHYCVPPLSRFNMDEINELIDRGKYFVLHAPRQTGKTSAMLALMRHINDNGRYKALYINAEKGQSAREDIFRGISAILGEIASRARDFLDDPFPLDCMEKILGKWREDSALNELLSQWSVQSEKPLILLIDEIDALIGDTLISVLRQLRAGYDKRPETFPQSVILCGVRDVRDYRIHSSIEKAVITGGSAFNIKAKSLRLGNFTREETDRLLGEHVNESGQRFAPDARDLIWHYSQGQPWLVNTLAYETCFEMKEGRDRSKPITAAMVIQAKENIILRRETHLDQLADKLRESRVRSVIQVLLAGTLPPGDLPEDDLQYVTDLGLIERKPQVRVSNPIYAEIIPRMLTETTQDMLPFETPWYVAPDGRLDADKLLTAFQEFFREHSEIWMERFDYKEAGPQLLLQAFLQRVINSGGRIEREYGLGRMRTDLMVIWNHESGVQKIVVELKILRKSLEKTVADGLAQTAEYLDRCGESSGHLVIFDRDPDKSWDEKLFRREETYNGRRIVVWGM